MTVVEKMTDCVVSVLASSSHGSNMTPIICHWKGGENEKIIVKFYALPNWLHTRMCVVVLT